MTKVWRLLSILIIPLMCLGLVVVPMVSSAAPPAGTAGFLAHVPGQPGNSTITISPGGSFDMNVTLDNRHGLTLYGAVAAMDFDASLLQVTGITNGTDWPTYLTAAWNNTAGWVVSEAAVAYPIVPLTQNTTQCVVHFQSTGLAGSTMVNFTTNVAGIYDTKVANDTGVDVLDWSSVQNFSVTIIGIPHLTVNVTPAGKGNVTINAVTPSSYPNTTNRSWDEVVNLTAVESVPNWTFTYWSGDLSGSANPTNITMDWDKNVTANFVLVGTTATLEGHVTFSGRGSNNTKWAEPFVVKGFEHGNLSHVLWTGNATTNNTGVFNITGLAPGTYDIGIKNWTCLSEVNTSVTLTAGNTTVVNFGTTREGDCNGDDWVTLEDRSLLYAGWDTEEVIQGGCYCDLNRDGWLTLEDRSLMYANWDQGGDLV